MTPDESTCPRCGRRLPSAARFCGACGAPASRTVDARLGSLAAGEAEGRRVTFAAMAVFAGSLLVLLLEAVAAGPLGASEGVAETLHWIGLAAVAGAAWWLLGREGRGGALPIRCGPIWWIAGPAGGLVTFGVAVAWVSLMGGGAQEAPPAGADLLFEVLLIAVLPAIVEEALCRGILWKALQGPLRPAALLFATAALFALLHGLNGALLLELPHRFVAGVAFGLLRRTSGSLLPGIAAHFVNNLLAILLP